MRFRASRYAIRRSVRLALTLPQDPRDYARRVIALPRRMEHYAMYIGVGLGTLVLIIILILLLT